MSYQHISRNYWKQRIIDAWKRRSIMARYAALKRRSRGIVQPWVTKEPTVRIHQQSSSHEVVAQTCCEHICAATSWLEDNVWIGTVGSFVTHGWNMPRLRRLRTAFATAFKTS